MAQDYNKAKRGVYMGLLLLGAVTLVEVFLSLFGKGYIISGVEGNRLLFSAVGVGLIVLSLYKAYFIVYEFMHMGHEVKGLRASVLLPMLLLVWAIIAFFQEGGSWGDRRAQIEQKDAVEVEMKSQPTGMLLQDPQTKKLQ